VIVAPALPKRAYRTRVRAKLTVPTRKKQGTLDWKKIFTAAKIGGIKNYFVEMDLEKMRASVPYLHQLKV
jgi:hypothetical protein